MVHIFRFLPLIEDPALDYLELLDEQVDSSGFSLLGRFGNSDRSVPINEIPRLQHRWKPPRVKLHHQMHRNDNPWIGGVIPTLSARAIAALRQFVEHDSELLPVECQDHEFYVYNPLTLANVLDKERSSIDWFQVPQSRRSQPRLAREILRYEFLPEVTRLSVFRIPEHPSWFFVTDPVVDRVKEMGLAGFKFEQVSPQPSQLVSRSRQ